MIKEIVALVCGYYAVKTAGKVIARTLDDAYEYYRIQEIHERTIRGERVKGKTLHDVEEIYLYGGGK